MQILPEIAAMADEMKQWRLDFHENPETAFEEERTAQLVAERLQSWGIEVHRGLAGTGVVGVLTGNQPGQRSIGMRADMDALHILEKNEFAHRSKIEGKMHACGHDGHTTMLLGSARYLADHRDFAGTVYFIFQPAEENEAGARVMIQDGLFDQFPMDTVYGMHNMPGMPVGRISMRPGACMASCDLFDIHITGKGSHAAMPHQGIDSIQVAVQIVSAIQTIVSRRVAPLDPLVISVTQLHAGDTYNVLPEDAVIRGTIRALSPHVQDRAEEQIRLIAQQIATAAGASVTFDFQRRYPVLVNEAEATDFCEQVAGQVVGAENVVVGGRADDTAPGTLSRAPCLMGSEDFAYMLNERPGCYIWLGNGAAGEKGSVPVHNPRYDFNDDIAAIGASYWVRLAQTALGSQG